MTILTLIEKSDSFLVKWFRKVLKILVYSIEKCLVRLIDNFSVVVWNCLLIIKLFIKLYLISKLEHLEELEHVMITQFFVSTYIKQEVSKFLPQWLSSLYKLGYNRDIAV